MLNDIQLTRQGKVVFGSLGIALVGIPLVLYGYKVIQERTEEVSFLEKVTSEKAQEKALDLVTEVGKLIDLPSGETPSIATVTEAEKLRGEEFYKNAQNGDRVLIYQKAHMAYLYRPSTRKLVSVMPVQFEEELRAEKERLNTQNSDVASASDSAEEATEDQEGSDSSLDSLPLE